ncbi:MAG: ATP-binding cassette domain-containing protein [Verrucomicrobiaceae bacterium]|nr:ATP-binding cassette domain-containing protein [Verrucomicrobiaceae bacterium]
MELLELEDLTLKRPRLRRRWFQHGVENEILIEDLSLTLESGGSLGLVGGDRSGLLSLSLALVKLEAVASGRIVFGGIDLTALTDRSFRCVRRRLQAVFPDSFGQLTPSMTVAEAFREVLGIWHRRESREQWHHRIESVMIAVGLPEAVRDLYPVELDAVERQQVALARALLTEPELLICHGFTEGLDAVQRAELLLLLRRIREDFRFALFVTTDDLAVARHLSDDIGVLHQGRLLESGRAEEVLHRPEHDYTRRLVSCSL